MGERQRNKGYEALPRTQLNVGIHCPSLVSHEAQGPLGGVRFDPEMLELDERVKELTFPPE